MARLAHAAPAAALLLLLLLSCCASASARSLQEEGAPARPGRPTAADAAARQRGDIDRAVAARLAELARAAPWQAQALEPIVEARTDVYVSTTHDVTSGPPRSYAANPGIDTKADAVYMWSRRKSAAGGGGGSSETSYAPQAWSIDVTRTLGAAPGLTKVAGLSDARKPAATVTVSGRLVQDFTTSFNVNGPLSGPDIVSTNLNAAADYVPDAELTSGAVEFNSTGTCVVTYTQRVIRSSSFLDEVCYSYYKGTLVSSPARKFKSVVATLTSSQPLSGKWVCKLDMPAVFSSGTCL